MSKYRNKLPQLSSSLFLTDGGLETTLLFHDGIDLPYFAAFDLLKSKEGIERLRQYFLRYVNIARQRGMGFVLEAPTWRASADWAEKLGYDATTLADANRTAIGLLLEIRQAYETAQTPLVISGNIGPRGDGYVVEQRMSVDQARDYHLAQIATFADSDADLVSAFTLNYVEEAIGIVEAARQQSIPVVISFTVETNGQLPSGESLAQAINRTDEATNGYVAYYMVNCAHPTHFDHALNGQHAWCERIGGVRANASIRSHAELDACVDLDSGNPLELGRQYQQLLTMLPNLNVVGGCCGTDHRHIEAICQAVA